MLIVKLLLILFGFCAFVLGIAEWDRRRCPVCRDKVEVCDVPVWGVGKDGVVREGAEVCGEMQPCPWHGGAQ